MQSKITVQQTSLLFILIYSIFFLISFFPNSLVKSYQETTDTKGILTSVVAASSSFNVSSRGLPIRLTIPRIGSNAYTEYVGMTQGGAMDTPKMLGNVAWYQSGTIPGDVGSAVITGHYGWKNGKVSAFDKLSMVKIGDKVLIHKDTGVTISFIVREIKTYDSQADTKDIFSSSDGLSHLNLITCEGLWNKELKMYTNRLVVFTDKEIAP
jgi:LPXTG-site transpeptidase (sortase) family protein